MKRKLILCIVLILIASFSLNLFSCDMTGEDGTTDTTVTTENTVKEIASQETTDDGDNETTCAETTDGELDEITAVGSRDHETKETTTVGTYDDEIEETGGGEDDDALQRFFSMDELLLAINDIDAFCKAIDGNGAGFRLIKILSRKTLTSL